METDDTTSIQASMTDLDQGLEQLSSARARSGACMQSLIMSDSWNVRLRIGLETDLGRLRDTDISRASMELAMAQQALEATLATAPAMMAQSILDRM